VFSPGSHRDFGAGGKFANDFPVPMAGKENGLTRPWSSRPSEMSTSLARPWSQNAEVLGIRDVSRELQFKSSYTVVEHAPEESKR